MTKDTKLILDTITEQMTGIRGDISGLKEDVSVLKEDVSVLKEDVSELKSQSSIMQAEITTFNLKMENVIEPKISFLADGHMDLMRKMNEVLEVHNGREMYIARLNKVEIDVDLLKKKVMAGA